MRRFVLATFMVITLMGGALLVIGKRSPSWSFPPPPQVSSEVISQFFSLSLPDIAGQMQPLAQWRGRVLIVNYWASWCGPCKREMPMLSALHRRLNGRGVQVVGIAADEHDKVAAYSATAPVSYPLLVAGKEAIRVTVPFGNVPQGVPFTLVFDQTGNVRAAILGAAHEEALEQLLATLI